MNDSLVIFFILMVIAFLQSSASGEVDESDPNPEFQRSFLKFEQFRLNFNKNYDTPHAALHRFMTFETNLRKISELNREERGTAVYGINHMTDWTTEEFLKKRANLKVKFSDTEDEPEVEISEVETDDPWVPDTFDWRFEDTVTPVKNQGMCGACWAFAAVGNIENLYAIKYNGNQSIFSEQQLLDCDEAESGCLGGSYNFPQTVVSSIIEKGGLDFEDSYPYEAQQGTCRFESDAVGVRVAKLNELDSRDEEAMVKYISSTSSTVNYINAYSMQFYKGGIMDLPFRVCKKNKRSLNHAVVTVGYGVHYEMKGNKSIPYWVMKNSWGEEWGESGFFRIKRGSNVCGMAHYIGAIVLA